MGAAWCHWNQPHLYSQISRYDLKGEIKASFDLSGGLDVSNTHFEDLEGLPLSAEEMNHEQEDFIYQKAAELYFNVDGAMGRKVMPFPQIPSYNLGMAELDKLTAFDRVEQISDQLTALEISALKTYLLLMSGGTPENAGFLDMLHWWALCDYRSDQIGDYEIAFKLKCGTSGLAKKIITDGLRSGNLTVKFSTAVQKIEDSADTVSVTTVSGATFESAKLISTIPLNVLRTVNFSPPLSPEKAAAIEKGHIGLHSKIHYEVSGRELRSWSGYSFPGQGILYAYGDDVTLTGNTHVVAFGGSAVPLHGEDDMEKTKDALLYLRKDLNIKRVLFHNWVRDPYAKSSWCMFPKEFATRYLGALQEKHGNIWFASADWADGWRGFIDGAIEQGTVVAQRVADSLAVTSEGKN